MPEVECRSKQPSIADFVKSFSLYLIFLSIFFLTHSQNFANFTLGIAISEIRDVAA